MTNQPVQPSGDSPAPVPSSTARLARTRVRRTMLSTGFSDVPGGSTCEVCGFKGFRWQTECPQGHPLG